MIGPVFQREADVATRRLWFHAARTAFAAALLVLALTSWQLLIGSQRIVSLGDLAWFGAAVFQILAPLQLAVALPFSMLMVASAVALEKDRKTLELLLLTNLSQMELVLGKLLAGMLSIVVVLVAAWPLFLILSLWGGVSTGQILRVELVTLAAALAAGSLGSTFALWREKTFPALALSMLVLVLWLAGWEVVATGALGDSAWGVSARSWAVAMSPWQAVREASQPQFAAATDSVLRPDPVTWNLCVSLVVAVVLNVVAIGRVRVWNPPQEARDRRREPSQALSTETGEGGATAAAPPAAASVHRAPGKVRPVWDNPILWREIRTWAYGKKVLLPRVAYLATFVVCVASVVATPAEPIIGSAPTIPALAKPLAGLMVLGLVLLNAQAVTSLTNERDSRALDLLLVTDLSPKEIVYGKLGGAFYNAKEVILLPVLLCLYLWLMQRMTGEDFLFVLGGWLVMSVFAAVLGLHAGITYANSRTAIATSIGVLLFLFLGVATGMRIMLAFSRTFEHQFPAFIGFIAGGSLGLFVALNWRYRSGALNWVALLTPLLTFIILTSYLLGHYCTVFLVTVATYGFAVAAMLKPAVSMFDVALGNAAIQEE